jgi:hypothetical protein
LICEGWLATGDPEHVFTLSPSRQRLLLAARQRQAADQLLSSPQPADRARGAAMLRAMI